MIRNGREFMMRWTKKFGIDLHAITMMVGEKYIARIIQASV